MAETSGTEAISLLTLTQSRELLAWHTARVNAELYRIGRICNEAVSDELRQQLQTISQSELRRACIVARKFTEADCMKYGVRRLVLLANYAEKYKYPWNEQEPGSTIIMVPAEEGPPLPKPFAECSDEELGRALNPPRQPLKSKPPLAPPPRSDAHCVQLLRDGVQKRFPKRSRAQVCASTRDGRLQLTLKRISVAELDLLAGAILESLAPLHEELYRRPVAPRPPVSLKVVPNPSPIQPLKAPADQSPSAPARAPAPAALGARTAS
jgi:hypothetical protein